MAGQKALLARIEGRVQGVGFRYSTVQAARRLGLSGYVRNLPDGAVEVLAEGDTGEIERLKAWLRRGPRGAVVYQASFREVRPTGTYRSFSIDY